MKIALLVVVLLANLSSVFAVENRLLPVEFVDYCKKINAELIPVADTGSMEPTFHGNTVLGIKRYPFSKIKKGDIIVFNRRGKLVVHRAVSCSMGEWTVKGDALPANDEDTVSADDYRGTVVTFHHGIKVD